MREIDTTDTKIPDSVERKILSAYRKGVSEVIGQVPKIVKIARPDGTFRAYASSAGWKLPDAYFDANGNLLLSVSGVLRFDGGVGATPAARDALRLAGLAVGKKPSGEMVWSSERMSPSSGASEIDPLWSIAFKLLSDAAFHQDRIGVYRRIEYAKRGDSAVMSESEIDSLIVSWALTIGDFVKLRNAGAVTQPVFEKRKRSVAARLPEQLLDDRFWARISAKNPDGTVAHIAPSWHGIDEAAVNSLAASGAIDGRIRAAALESLALLRKQAEEFGIVRSRTHAASEVLKREVSAG